MSNSRVDWSAKVLAEDWAAVGMKMRLIQHYAASIKAVAATTATTTKPLQLQISQQPVLFMRARCAWQPSQQLYHLYV